MALDEAKSQSVDPLVIHILHISYHEKNSRFSCLCARIAVKKALVFALIGFGIRRN